MARQAIKISGNIDFLKQAITALNSRMVEIINKNSEDTQPEVRLNLPDCVTILVHGKKDQKSILERLDKTFTTLDKTDLSTIYGHQYGYSKDGAELLTVVAMSEKDAYMRNWRV